MKYSQRETYNDSETLCMLSGLSYPKTRLDAVYKRISENRETVLRNMQTAAGTKLNEDVNFLSGFSNPQKEEKPKSAGMEIMAWYGISQWTCRNLGAGRQ